MLKMTASGISSSIFNLLPGVRPRPINLPNIFLSGISIGWFMDYHYIHFIFLPIIFLCYYPIGKILNNHRFEKIIESIDNSREFRTKWFGFNLSMTNSVILLSVSSGTIFLLISQLFIMNMSAGTYFSDPYGSYYFFMLFSLPVMAVIIFLILVVIIYTIKKHFLQLNLTKIGKLLLNGVRKKVFIL